MSSSVNKWIGMGNLVRDPELKYTPGGKAVCDFTVALNYSWKGQDGKKNEEVSFIDVVTFGKQAEHTAEYCKKGKQLIIEGRLQQDRWEDKSNGQKRSKVKVIGERITFVGKKDEEVPLVTPDEEAAF